MMTMRRLSVIILAGVLAAGVVACTKRSPEPSEPTRAHYTPPPTDSKLAKVQVGMSPREVQNVMGAPDDENAYVTGKAFIPWYFGRDRTRTAYFYKNQGRVVFAGTGGWASATGKVSRVEYDPTEDGRAR